MERQQIEVDVTNRIYEMMADQRIKQVEVANAIGLSPQVFNGILKHRRPLRVQYIVSLCRALNCDPNELFGYKTRSRSIVVTDENREVVAVITDDSLEAHKGYHITLSKAR